MYPGMIDRNLFSHQLGDRLPRCASYERVVLNPPSYIFGRGGLEISSSG